MVVPEFVYGANDDRQVYYPSTWPWFLVGLIDVFKYGSLVWSGCGALVGTNVVLTASHVVPWGAGSGNWAMSFMPAFYDSQSTQGIGVFSWTQSAKGYSDYGQGDDMAVLKLYEPLGNYLGYFGYKTYNDDWEGVPCWCLLGYPVAVGGGVRPTWQASIKVLEDDSDGAGVELEHTGDATVGNSGGPLWSWWGNSPRVIGTHSGSENNYAESNNVAAGGSALSSLIKWARDHW
jgi:V8-like Glu-specific endopeptidase